MSGAPGGRPARAGRSVRRRAGRRPHRAAAAALGAAALVERLRGEGRATGHAADLAARLAAAIPAPMLERADRLGVRFVVPGDEEWPAGLDDLARAGPVADRGGVPLGLWVRGPLRLAGDRGVAGASAVAVVGSRRATSYGEAVAREVAADLAAAGHTVVSGAAFGIDVAAHRGALAGGGPTLAVLACGADRVYPEAHRHLLSHLARAAEATARSSPRPRRAGRRSGSASWPATGSSRP